LAHQLAVGGEGLGQIAGRRHSANTPGQYADDSQGWQNGHPDQPPPSASRVQIMETVNVPMTNSGSERSSSCEPPFLDKRVNLHSGQGVAGAYKNSAEAFERMLHGFAPGIGAIVPATPAAIAKCGPPTNRNLAAAA